MRLERCHSFFAAIAHLQAIGFTLKSNSYFRYNGHYNYLLTVTKVEIGRFPVYITKTIPQIPYKMHSISISNRNSCIISAVGLFIVQWEI